MAEPLPRHAAISLAIEAIAAMPNGTNREDRAAAVATLRVMLEEEIERERAKGVVERSCFTCRRDVTDPNSVHSCRSPDRADPSWSRRVYEYCVASGAGKAADGMPTDRTIACPGWAAKESTAGP